MADAALRISIVGAAGYAGRELVRLLLAHPRARIVGLYGSERRGEGPPASIGDLHPSLMGQLDLPVVAAEAGRILGDEPDAVFLATPHEASMELAAALLAGPRRPVVLDLSAAFRLRPAGLYPKHYGFEHHKPELLGRAVYGMAELNAAAIASAELVAVPGCYPTSAVLPLAPLVKAGAIDASRRVIIDAVSGVSGAGRSPTLKSLFGEVSLQAYNVLKHRHQPEIDLYVGAATVFTPHLVEFDRGILSTIHAELTPGWDAARVGQTLRAAYAGRPFVRLLGEDRWPSVAGVRMSNFCDVGWAVDAASGHLVIGSAIDNLVKGASGQAVQCMNIRFGMPEWAGILPKGPTGEGAGR